MSEERCIPHRDNLAAYALGALDAEDISALETHVADCEKCQSELADYQGLTMELLQSTPPQMPPERLRRKLVAQLPSNRSSTQNWFANFFGNFSFGQFATGIAVLILLGITIFSSMEIRDLQQQQSALAERVSHDRAAIAMLAYPGTKALPVHADVGNLAGSMLVDEDKNTAVLVLWNLPQLEAENTYQVWLIDSTGKRISGGLFDPADEQGYTTVTIQSPVPIGKFVGLGVTIEPSGGSEGPTGPRVLAVNL